MLFRDVDWRMPLLSVRWFGILPPLPNKWAQGVRSFGWTKIVYTTCVFGYDEGRGVASVRSALQNGRRCAHCGVRYRWERGTSWEGPSRVVQSEGHGGSGQDAKPVRAGASIPAGAHKAEQEAGQAVHASQGARRLEESSRWAEGSKGLLTQHALLPMVETEADRELQPSDFQAGCFAFVGEAQLSFRWLKDAERQGRYYDILLSGGGGGL